MRVWRNVSTSKSLFDEAFVDKDADPVKFADALGGLKTDILAIVSTVRSPPKLPEGCMDIEKHLTTFIEMIQGRMSLFWDSLKKGAQHRSTVIFYELNLNYNKLKPIARGAHAGAYWAEGIEHKKIVDHYRNTLEKTNLAECDSCFNKTKNLLIEFKEHIYVYSKALGNADEILGEQKKDYEELLPLLELTLLHARALRLEVKLMKVNKSTSLNKTMHMVKYVNEFADFDPEHPSLAKDFIHPGIYQIYIDECERSNNEASSAAAASVLVDKDKGKGEVKENLTKGKKTKGKKGG
jgi:hypothetical protein